MRRLGLALAVGGLLACSPPTHDLPPIVEGPEPIIDSLEIMPRRTTTQDEPISFMAAAHSRDGKRLTYTWSVTAGTLSATSGNQVSWLPTNAAGELKPGPATLTLVVSDGKEQTKATLLLQVGADGGVGVNVGAATPGGPRPMGGGSNGISLPSGTEAPATPGPSPSASASPVACTAEETLEPTHVAPGAIAYVRGKGFTSAVKANLGEVVKATDTLLGVRVPADARPGKLALTLTGCTAKPFELTVEAGTPVTAFGQGLIQRLHTVDGDPRGRFDLSKLPVTASYVVPDINVEGGELVGRSYLGQLETPAAQIRFTVAAWGGVKLFIDEKLVIDRDPNERQELVDGDATLTAGQHALRLEYVPYGSNRIQLLWRLPGQPLETPIPASAFAL